MKRLLLSLSSLAVLVFCAGSYRHGAREERRLQLRWATSGTETEAGEEEAAGAVASGLKTHTDSRGTLIAQALRPPVPKKLTPGEAEEFFTRWSTDIKTEEKRLLDAKQAPFGKMKPHEDYLAKLPAGDLLAICLAIPSGESVMHGGMNWESSDTELRQLMWTRSFRSMVDRFPFLSLQLPWNQPDAKPWSETNSTLKSCAAQDAEATWEIVQQRFGGKNAEPSLLRSVLEGAAREDLGARLDLARQWGVLDKVAKLWTREAAQTPAGQEAWIHALKETAPADRDRQAVEFTRELESSEGFAGVQRLISHLAQPGTPLHDSILLAAAGRDLEEAAGPKADWIVSQVTPGAANATAETLMKNWTKTDPLSASEWLDKVPKSAPWRQAAVLAFAKAIEPHDPEAAALWRKTGSE
ncbi:MAG: hypothetical protein V4726_22695 [Verrucomicrobiota bacterium]